MKAPTTAAAEATVSTADVAASTAETTTPTLTTGHSKGGLPKILVTGAGGQLGQSLRTLVRAARVSQRYLFAAHEALDVTCASDIATWLDSHRIDCVINAAAYTAVDRAAHEPARALAVNAEAAGSLARVCAQRGMRLIHLSTDYVFDGRLPRPYCETDHTNPPNVYGHSKLRGEDAIRRWHPEAIIIRTSWLFGATGEGFVHRLLRDIDRAQASGQALRLPVADDQTGSPTWAAHLATVLHQLACTSDWTGHGGLYHFAGAPCVSRYTLAREVIREAQANGWRTDAIKLVPVDSSHWPQAQPRPANSCLDCDKIESWLGPLARDWRDGITHLLRKRH